MVELSDDLPSPIVQTETAKKHYNNLYYRSMLSVVLYSIPAVFFTVVSIILYFGFEERWSFLHLNFYQQSDVNTIISIVAAVGCWGLFFWFQVRKTHKRAELWRKSMESYEALVLSESQFKTEEEKREAARQSIELAEINRMNNDVKNENIL